MDNHPRYDRCREIEMKHLGRCLDQMWDQRRMTLIELMDYPKAKSQAILIKRFETPVPKSGSSKPWPDLLACYVFLPVDDKASMTWEGLDAALTTYEGSR